MWASNDRTLRPREDMYNEMLLACEDQGDTEMGLSILHVRYRLPQAAVILEAFSCSEFSPIFPKYTFFNSFAWGRRAYSFVAYLSGLTVGSASFSRRSTEEGGRGGSRHCPRNSHSRYATICVVYCGMVDESAHNCTSNRLRTKEMRASLYV